MKAQRSYMLVSLFPLVMTLGCQSWELTGNSGTNPSSNFLGTTDNQPLVIKTNGLEAMRIDDTGNVGIGTTSPTNRLSLVGNADFTGDVGIGESASGLAHLLVSGSANNNTGAHIFVAADSGSERGAVLSLSAVGNGGHNFQIISSGASNPAGPVKLLFRSQTNNLDLMTLTPFRVGFGMTSPTFPLEMASGAHVTMGGVWTDASSRKYKEDISSLELQEALNTLQGLEPVKYRIKRTENERHLGFIAEDVPNLVATKDRKGLSPMDIVAVLTKVVQQQQKEIGVIAKSCGFQSEMAEAF